MPPIITIDRLGKQYTLRHERGGRRYRRLSEELVAALKRPFRRPRQEANGHIGRETFWALRDVSFEVQEGEVLGIIGRNGAGKSTLLKILSRITEPSEGRVHLRGRVASLLEVGTGFHPELTGRENVFLNGAVLGMTRAEIKEKFDEIVAFAEVEKFLDTPVKHYSSGMYVRLAFSVAAHLDPEILIVDEVLAVGDAEFQKKCMARMSATAQCGRTVLFVSHNLGAINALTTRCAVLNTGRVIFEGSTSDAIACYAQSFRKLERETVFAGSGVHTKIISACLLDADGDPTGTYAPGTPLRVQIALETDGSKGLSVDVILLDATGTRIAFCSPYHFDGVMLPERAGRYRLNLEVAPPSLASGSYSLDIFTAVPDVAWDHQVERAVEFEVPYAYPGSLPWDHQQSMGYGAVSLPCIKAPVFNIEVVQS